MRRAKTKVRNRASLRRTIARRQKNGDTIVFTSGCYDLLHIGHLRGFENARTQGDALVVGVNRDKRVRQLKGPNRPVVSENQRAEMIAGLECVDYVVLFGENDAGTLIRALKPDVVCKGGEYRGTRIPEKVAIEELGGRFHLIRQIPGIRTTSLLERARR